jgi:phosphinothricin acetyltransferase
LIDIGEMAAADWPDVSRIYAEGMATRNATFETDLPSWEKWDASHLATCRLVARENGVIVGWAALSPISSRYAYRGVCEVSVYVADSVRGKGVGRRLLESLVDTSEQDGRWMLQASVFPENEASVALHTACGFRVLGRRERVAQLDGVWRDTLILERRSRVAGA